MRTWEDGELVAAVQSSSNLSEAITKLGLRPAGGNFLSLNKHIRRLGIPTSHFQGVTVPAPKRLTFAEVFKEHSSVCGAALRRFTLRHKVIPFICKGCGNRGFHNGKPLTLQLDHVNGVYNDNRIGNLRFLCPNCHSQTSTYARRDFSKDRFPTRSTVTLPCSKCSTPFEKNAVRYRHLVSRGRTEFFCSPTCSSNLKIDRSTVLTEYAVLKSYLAVAKKLGVSDVTVRKIVVEGSP